MFIALVTVLLLGVGVQGAFEHNQSNQPIIESVSTLIGDDDVSTYVGPKGAIAEAKRLNSDRNPKVINLEYQDAIVCVDIKTVVSCFDLYELTER